MYKLVYTIGNAEKIIGEFYKLDVAKSEKKRLEKSPEYSAGILTVESGEGKVRKIW